MRRIVPHLLQLTLWLLIGCGAGGLGRAAPGPAIKFPPNAIAWAETNLSAARLRQATEMTNSAAAWELGRACFTWGKFLTDPRAQETIYTEGVAACRRSLSLAPQAAAAHYYLGMNIGRVADLKRNLAAFGLVKEVERAFQQAAKLDPQFAHAGPDRNLGLLYQHAPGWPLSVGDKKRARQHLERAAHLAPGYPENRLNLAEAYQAWREPKLYAQELTALRQLWPAAKTNFTGGAWELDWADWETRRAKLPAALPGK